MARNLTKIRHQSHFRQIKRHYLLGLLFLIISVLSYLNYQPGTYLIGWDNLQSDLNLGLNLRRAIFSVWQEYQSLGLLAGMAHAADIPHQLVLFLASYLPGFLASYARYLWTFLMLFLGPIGTYVLLYRAFLRRHFDHQTNHFASFLGGLFYLLNLSTLQQFFTPFETFIAFYGFLPWLIYSLITYLEHPKAVNLFLLFLISFLATPSFVTETLFVVYALCLICFFIKHKGFVQVFLSSLVIFVANAFWLLPNLFFVLTNGAVGLTAKMNLIATPETYYRNLEYGNLANLTLLRGFWFNFLDLSGGSKFDYLMTPWRNHLANPTIYLIGYLSFALVLTGIVYSLKKKIPYAKPFLGIFAICYFFLLGGGLLINSQIPLLGELFRSPFTKFSTPLALSYSIFFAVGCIFLLDLFSFLHSRLTYILTLFTVSLALIIYMTPAFTGNLISPSMRVKIPNEYFQLFDFFKSQDPATRIANFPQYTFWGWNYYSWGYRGSGFLWYGIKQPLLDRAFDVWERSSERYYEEVSAAIYSENQAEFENLVDKYAINWLLIDKNVIAPDKNIDLGLDKLQKFIDNSNKFTLAKNIDDKILVYKTNVDQKVKNFLFLTSPHPSPYQGEGAEGEVLHPFAHLSLRPSPVVIPGHDPESIQIDSRVRGNDNQVLAIPSYSDTESLTPNAISYRKTATGLEVKLTPILPEINFGKQKVTLTSQANIVDFPLETPASGLVIGINGQYFEIQLPDELTTQPTFYPLTNIYLPPQKNINLTLFSNTPSNRLDLTSFFNQAQPYQCYTNKPNRKIEKVVDRQTISLLGTDTVGCLSVPLPPIDTLNQLLSLEFTYSSHTGTPGNASITDASLGGSSSPQPLPARNESSFTRIYAHPRPVPIQANLILEANEIKTTQEIIYQNVQVSYLPQLGEANLIPHPIPNQQIKMSNEQRAVSNISISLPIVESSLTVRSTPESSNFLASVGNCDNFNQGKFDRQTSPDGFLYTATNANACDQINLKHLPHGVNYALIADIQNQAGLFPTVCLENYSTRHCDVFERLVNGPQLVIQPVSNPNENAGYTLHLFNQSFGNRPVANLLKSVAITPLPLNFLKNITISSSLNTKYLLLDTSAVSNSTHPAEFIYTASVSDSSDTKINLYQTRSPYWKALLVSESDLSLPTWQLILKLPLMSFRARPGIYSNRSPIRSGMTSNEQWFNSWPLPSGTHYLVIFYLPQYLEFLGFLLLPLPLIGLLIYSLLKPRQL